MTRPPSLRNLNLRRTVEIRCINNDRMVQAQVVSQDRSRLIVTLPGNTSLIMTPHASQPGVFLARMAGMEFSCTPGTPRT
jgi:hypothetical protein